MQVVRAHGNQPVPVGEVRAVAKGGNLGDGVGNGALEVLFLHLDHQHRAAAVDQGGGTAQHGVLMALHVDLVEADIAGLDIVQPPRRNDKLAIGASAEALMRERRPWFE